MKKLAIFGAAMLLSQTASAQGEPVVVQTAQPPPQVVYVQGGQPPPPGVYTATPMRPWQAGDPIPPGFHTKEVPNKPIIMLGLGKFLGAYAIAVIVGAIANANRNNTVDIYRQPLGGAGDYMFIPVVGPWIEIGSYCYGMEYSRCDGWEVAFIVLNGIIQDVGAIVMTYGIAKKKTVLERDEAAPQPVGKLKLEPVFGLMNGLKLTF